MQIAGGPRWSPTGPRIVGAAVLAACLGVLLLAGPGRALAAPEIGTDPGELIFSAVVGQATAPSTFLILNTGTAALAVTSLALAGAQPGSFALVSPPATPFVLASGASAAVNVRFVPGSVGSLSALLRIASDDADEPNLDVGLYGLSAQGLEGGNEPPLDRVVTTLGYAIDVGGTTLVLGTGPAPIGEEVLLPLFEKAGAGDVRMVPVARYSPAFVLDFGYYVPAGASPNRVLVGQLSGSANPPQHQTLFPEVISGGVAFDPGAQVFGVYTTGSTHSIYSEDGLNALLHPLNVEHAVRVYPLRDRAGVAVPNAYLVGFEEATNGDYQDYVFTLYNVRPPGSVTDDDHDGFSPPADCDDTDQTVFPGATELCDGRDNDCDGTADDGNPGGGGSCDTGQPGICAAGTEQCQGGTLVCANDSAPEPEQCGTGIDEDCDGSIDENDECALCLPDDTVSLATQTIRNRIKRNGAPASDQIAVKGTFSLPAPGASRPDAEDVTVRLDGEAGVYWEATLAAGSIEKSRSGRRFSYTDRDEPFEHGGVYKAKLTLKRDLTTVRYVVKAKGLDLVAFSGARSTVTVRIGRACYADTGDACTTNGAATATTCR